MTRPKRYTLIVIGFIIFFVMAPFFVMGIRGYVFDFKTRSFVKTGILVAKTEPKGATLTLTGPKVVKAKTSATIRFLTPGDYVVNISKDGYLPWEKRLTVRGGLVTWVNVNNSNIVLLPTNPTPVATSQTAPIKNSPEKENTSYRIEQSPTAGIYDLVKVDGNDKTVLLHDVPNSTDYSVLDTGNGLIFLTLGNTLYQVTDQLHYISDNVDIFNWDNKIKELVYGNSFELDLYNPYDAGSDQKQLLLRTSESGGSFCIAPGLGYVLRAYGNKVKAFELDGRDKRNTYDLLTSSNELQLISCDTDGKEVVIKDGSAYKTYNFRSSGTFSFNPLRLFN